MKLQAKPQFPKKSKKPVKSLLKALRILDKLGDCPGGSGITEMSDALRAPKSTVHRLIVTLEEAGYVIFDPQTSKYGLSSRVAWLGEQLNQQSPLLTFGVPMLEQLTRECHEASHLAILQGKEVLYISHEESREPVRISFGRGHRAPLHCTALGKVFLAGLSEGELRMLYKNEKKLRRLTPNTVTSLRALAAEIAVVRKEGIAYDNEEYMIGLRCMAAPVRDFTSRIVAAMSLSMFKHKMTEEKKAFFRDTLRRCSMELSRQLGFLPAVRKPGS